MDKNHLNDDFAKIAELFQKYKLALSSNNNVSAVDGLKNKIVIQFWKTIQKSAISDEMKEQSDLIVNKIVYCLGKYSDKEAEEFCKLTYSSIMKTLKSKADVDNFETKSGMHITDPQNRLRKQIEKAHKQYLMFNKDDKNAFIEYAVTYLGFNREDVEEYLSPKRTIPLYAKNKDNTKEYYVVDKHTDTTNQKDYAEVEDSIERLKKQLKAIDELWAKQKTDAKSVLSELITRELLADFSKNTVSENVIKALKNACFVDQNMLKSFFDNPDFKLPSQQEVGEKYNLTKSAASVKLKRFLNNL